MRWLTKSIQKTCNGVVLIVVSASLAIGCSANVPRPDRNDRPANDNRNPDVAVVPEISFDVPHASTPLADHAREVEMPSSWVAIRSFTFDYDNSSIGSADSNKATEISEYISRNPALQVVIDGSVNPRGIDPHNPGLRDRRVKVVREALIAAGVSAFMIETRAVGSERALGDRSIEVLVKTAP